MPGALDIFGQQHYDYSHKCFALLVSYDWIYFLRVWPTSVWSPLRLRGVHYNLNGWGLAWINDYIPYKVWDEIIYPFPNVNDAIQNGYQFEYICRTNCIHGPCTLSIAYNILDTCLAWYPSILPTSFRITPLALGLFCRVITWLFHCIVWHAVSSMSLSHPALRWIYVFSSSPSPPLLLF